MRHIFPIILLLVSFSAMRAEAQGKILTKSEALQKRSQEENFSQKMVDFIRKLLHEKPKPIDEKLIRDEM